MSIHDNALDAFDEQFSDILHDGYLKDGETPPKYWQDTISELADGLVPVNNSELVDEWTEAGYPEVDEPDIIEGVTDIMRIIGVALYELYTTELYGIANDAGFND